MYTLSDEPCMTWGTDPTGMAMFRCYKEVRNCWASAESCRTWQGDSEALQTTYGEWKVEGGVSGYAQSWRGITGAHPKANSGSCI